MLNIQLDSIIEGYSASIAGKPALILGSGHSLAKYNVDKIAEDHSLVTFAVNAAVCQLTRCNFFCFSDDIVTHLNYFKHGCEIADFVCVCNPYLFNKFTDDFRQFVHKALRFERRYEDQGYSNNKLDWFDGKLIFGADCTQIAAHIANILGLSPLVLLGIDLDYSGKATKYVNGNEFDLVNNDTPAKFKEVLEERLQLAKSGNTDVQLKWSEYLWNEIKKQNSGVKILNASDGTMDWFERINLNTYFK